MRTMLASDAMKLPEAPPILVKGSAFGLATPKVEGMAYWRDLDGNPWWEVVIDGVSHRQTYGADT